MAQENNTNPLQKYFRQPRLYIRLPSEGNFYPPGSLNKTETGEYPVYSMTARDELTFKTPDALLNGQATVSVIQSCVPDIKNAWLMPSIDIDAILIAIRIATYGEYLTVTSHIPVINEERDFEVDLRSVTDQFSNQTFDEVVTVGNLKIHLRPLTYKEFTKSALRTFEEQRIFNLVNDDQISEEDKLQAFTNSFVKLTELTVSMINQSISYIEDGDVKVHDQNHIADFMKNTDKEFFSGILKHLESQKDKFTIKPMTALTTEEDQARGAPKEYTIPITFDQSNFFA